MKKLITLLLAAALLASLTACGGAEPAETTAATTEAIVVETEAAPTEVPTEESTEESTEAPTEPRVAPTNFEPVDPTSLPEPIPVEEQLQSEDTQTVTLGSLEEYEDLLWELGFQEVRLSNVFASYAKVDEATSANANAESSCEPVGLTYNDRAFRLDFNYCQKLENGDMRMEEGWWLYGTKSAKLENISPISKEEYKKVDTPTTYTLNLDEGQNLESFLQNFDYSSLGKENGLTDGAIEGGVIKKEEGKVQTAEYEEEQMKFESKKDMWLSVNIKAVYYPVTGNLYNYMRNPAMGGESINNITVNQNYNYMGQNTRHEVGLAARTMCFHYLFPAEDAAE